MRHIYGVPITEILATAILIPLDEVTGISLEDPGSLG